MRAPFLLAVLMISVSTYAQSARPTYQQSDDRTTKGAIRGRVVTSSSTMLNESVRITLLTINGIQATAYSDNAGWFEFSDLIPGNYEVQVEANGNQFEVVNQSVQVFRGAPSIITISLRDRSSFGKREHGEKTVSVGELGGDIPEAARKEFEAASKAGRKNESDKAIAHLRKAIKLYPNFVMARNDLGAQLLAQGRLDEAADELRQAIALDVKAFNPKLNLGIVYVQQHNFSEAIEQLDSAIALKPDSPAARLYSGEARLAIGDLERAEIDLRAAYSFGGSSFSLALFHLGQLYMNQGNRQMAQRSFELYLRDTPNAANADQVRKMIAMLH